MLTALRYFCRSLRAIEMVKTARNWRLNWNHYENSSGYSFMDILTGEQEEGQCGKIEVRVYKALVSAHGKSRNCQGPSTTLEIYVNGVLFYHDIDSGIACWAFGYASMKFADRNGRGGGGWASGGMVPFGTHQSSHGTGGFHQHLV